MADWVENLHPRDELGRWTFSTRSGGYLVDDDDRDEISQFADRSYQDVLKDNPKLSDDEAESVSTYTFTAFDLNKQLRRGQLARDRNDMVGKLDAAIDRSALTQDTILYRYMGKYNDFDYSPALQKMSEMKPGEVMIDKAFVSTSTGRGSELIGKGKIAKSVMKILAPAGSKALAVPRSFEEEVILPRNSQFEFVGEDLDGSRVFRLKQEGVVRSGSAKQDLGGGNLSSQSIMVKYRDDRPGEYSGGPTEVLINPNERDFWGLIKDVKDPDARYVRTAIDANGNLFAWHGYYATHDMIENSVTFGGAVKFVSGPGNAKYQQPGAQWGDARSSRRFTDDTDNKHLRAMIARGQENAKKASELKVVSGAARVASSRTRTKSFIDQAPDNVFVQAYAPHRDEKTGKMLWSTPGRSFEGGSSTWMEKDDKDLEEQAKEAVLTLGDNTTEFAAIIAKSGPEYKSNEGTRVFMSVGEQHHCAIPANVLMQMMSGRDTENEPSFELHHNHPIPMALSLGDVEFLNNAPAVVEITAYDTDGGTSSATIPGRTSEFPHAKWEDFSYEIMGYSNRLDKSSRDLSFRAFQKVGEYPNAVSFLRQHAALLGLQDAGFIDYKFKLSEKQEAWREKCATEFAGLVSLSRKEAAKIESAKMTGKMPMRRMKKAS